MATAGQYQGVFEVPGWAEGSEAGWDRVVQEFDIKGDEASEPDAVFAIYEQGGYEGDALVAYRRGDRAFLVEGSHCSCFGLEGQWSPTEYDSVDELIATLRRREPINYPALKVDEVEAALAKATGAQS